MAAYRVLRCRAFTATVQTELIYTPDTTIAIWRLHTQSSFKIKHRHMMLKHSRTGRANFRNL